MSSLEMFIAGPGKETRYFVKVSLPPQDRGDVVLVQREVRRSHDRIDLFRAPEAGDGPVHGRVAEGPGHRDRPWRGVVAGGGPPPPPPPPQGLGGVGVAEHLPALAPGVPRPGRRPPPPP